MYQAFATDMLIADGLRARAILSLSTARYALSLYSSLKAAILSLYSSLKACRIDAFVIDELLADGCSLYTSIRARALSLQPQGLSIK